MEEITPYINCFPLWVPGGKVPQACSQGMLCFLWAIGIYFLCHKSCLPLCFGCRETQHLPPITYMWTFLPTSPHSSNLIFHQSWFLYLFSAYRSVIPSVSCFKAYLSELIIDTKILWAWCVLLPRIHLGHLEKLTWIHLTTDVYVFGSRISSLQFWRNPGGLTFSLIHSTYISWACNLLPLYPVVPHI